MNDLDAKLTALNAIQEEAEKLLAYPLVVEVRDAVERILSIARYQADVRTADEQHKSQT